MFFSCFLSTYIPFSTVTVTGPPVGGAYGIRTVRVRRPYSYDKIAAPGHVFAHVSATPVLRLLRYFFSYVTAGHWRFACLRIGGNAPVRRYRTMNCFFSRVHDYYLFFHALTKEKKNERANNDDETSVFFIFPFVYYYFLRFFSLNNSNNFARRRRRRNDDDDNNAFRGGLPGVYGVCVCWKRGRSVGGGDNRRRRAERGKRDTGDGVGREG